MIAEQPISGLGYEWKEAGDILDVPTDIALDLFIASHGIIHEYLESTPVEEEPEAVKPLPTRATKAPKSDLPHALDVASVTTNKPKAH